MNKFFVVFFGVFSFLVFSEAQAQFRQYPRFGDSGGGLSNFYVGFSFGSALNKSLDFNVSNPTHDRSGDITLDHEIGMTPSEAFLGYHLSDNIRLEGAVFWLPYNIEDASYDGQAIPQDIIDLFPPGTTVDDLVQASGEVDFKGVTLNAFYDVEHGNWNYFVGAGVGMAMVEIDSEVRVVGRLIEGGGDDFTEMGQLEAGAGYQLSELINLFGNYRHSFFRGSTVENYSGGSSIDLESSMSPSFELGARINFGRR